MQTQDRDRTESSANLPEWAKPKVREYKRSEDILNNSNGKGPPSCPEGPPGECVSECAKDPNCNPSNVPIDGVIFEFSLILGCIFLGVFKILDQFKEASQEA